MLKHYPIRAIKSILMFFIVMILCLTVMYFVTGASSVDDLIPPGNRTRLLIFLAFFGLIYPFIGYIAHKVPLSHPLTASDKELIKKVFADARFELVRDEDNKLIFRPTSALTRFMRMYEPLEVDYSGNPAIVEGLRRDAFRLGRAIEWQLRRADENDKTSEEK